MPTHTIGFVAKSAKVTVDTVRYYEREGLLSKPSRTASGYRLYTEVDVERLQFIRQAKALGFTLQDITELLRLQDGHGTRQQVRARVQARIKDLNRKIRELTAIREALVGLERQCCDSGPIPGCPIIEGVRAISLEPYFEN